MALIFSNVSLLFRRAVSGSVENHLPRDLALPFCHLKFLSPLTYSVMSLASSLTVRKQKFSGSLTAEEMKLLRQRKTCHVAKTTLWKKCKFFFGQALLSRVYEEAGKFFLDFEQENVVVCKRLC